MKILLKIKYDLKYELNRCMLKINYKNLLREKFQKLPMVLTFDGNKSIHYYFTFR